MKPFFNVALFAALLSLVAPHSASGSAVVQISAQEESPHGQPPPETPPQAAPTPAVQQAPDPSVPQPQTSASPNPAPGKSRPVHKSSVKKLGAKTKTPDGSQPGKVVVKNGGARDSSGQISPGISAEQESHQRETTSQLLSTTDANLKKIAGRPLTSPQQNMLEQIHRYLSQAKTATDAGDVARAHTLAFKAHLLSDELARK